MILKPLLVHYARPPLDTRFGRERAGKILDETFKRCASRPRGVPQESSLGGRLMVYLAALTAALYSVLVDEGLDRAQARAETANITRSIYDKMAEVPWLIARISTVSPIARLERATNAFRRFPFGPPAYVMEDVPSDDRTVAFDVKRCPVATYFRAQGLSELCVESFCNLDFALAERWGARLERTTTLAAGDTCCNFRWRLTTDT